MKKLNHLAIIMDGNGRWAQLRKKSRTVGHIQGVRVAKKIITCARELQIPNLTLYAFSSENWARPQPEVRILMRLLHKYLIRERKTLIKQNIRFQVLGQIERLPREIVKEIGKTMEATAKCDGMVLSMALSYSGREDILQAVRKIVELSALGKVAGQDINEDLVSRYLETALTPDPDMIIRTSGEKRLSNFLLWQSAYSELYFTEVHWPDFTKNDLLKAIEDYNHRERRFGQTSQQVFNK